jgi:hypothetical protein
MRLKIMIVFFVLAIVTGACGAAGPVLSSGPNLPFTVQASPTETVPAQPAGGTANLAVLPPPQGLDLTGGYPFIMYSDSPRYLPAFTQPDAGCAWVGVAGQVLDQSGAPLEGVVVLVKGTFNGKRVDARTFSGQQTAYGVSGFEVQIGDLSADSANTLTIQLANSKLEALSEVAALTTYNDCQRNLLLVNFQAQSDSWQALLP